MKRHQNVLIDSATLAGLMIELMDLEDVVGIVGGEVDEEEGIIKNVPSGIWEVSWPDHVIHPRYNYDASYLGVAFSDEGEIPRNQLKKLYRRR
jgi:hypothetical protein